MGLVRVWGACLLREAGVGAVRCFYFRTFLQKILVSICLGVFSLRGEKWRCCLGAMLAGSRWGSACAFVIGFEVNGPVGEVGVKVS